MSRPIAPGPGFAPPPPLNSGNRMKWGEDARSAPVTPAKRMPVIDRSKVDPQLLKAAEGMESMFLDHLMQTMRKTIQDHPLDLDNHASRMYRSMLDTETAKTAARTGGVGISDLIIAYMQAPRYNVSEGNNNPPPAQKSGAEFRTGGTDEGP